MLLKNLHWIYFLLAIFKWHHITYLLQGTWSLNRTIGWGYDITNLVWWLSLDIAGTFWLSIFAVTYWIFRRLGYFLFPVPTYLHLILTVLSLFYFGQFDGFIDGLCIGQFFINVILIIFMNRKAKQL